MRESRGFDGCLDMDIWHERGGAEGWRRMLAHPAASPVIHQLRRSTYAGRPFGDESFIAATEALLNRHWQRWPFEQALLDTDRMLGLDAKAR